MAESRTWNGAIRSTADTRRVLDDINAAGLIRANTTELPDVIRAAGDVALRPDASRLLAVDERLLPLLPWPGLRKGATVALVGSQSLLLLLLGEAMREGAYAAVAGLPHLGLLSALQNHGIPGERLALVPELGPDWPTVVGALIDGFDLVVVGTPADVPDGTTRSLRARARERGCVLVPTSGWPGADLMLEVTSRHWDGLRQGGGRLKRQHLNVTATGKGRAARPRTAQIVLGEPDVTVNLPPVRAAETPIRSVNPAKRPDA